MKKPYVPPKKILERYANVLVNFALGDEKGIKKGETVIVMASDASKPLYAEVLKAIWKSGGNVISRYTPSDTPEFKMEREFYLNASDAQIKHFPAKLMRGQVDSADHSLFLIDDTDLKALQGIDPKKMMMRGEAWKQGRVWRDEKERMGKFTWTLALYGTPAMAKEAKMSEKEYWDQIIKACFLDKKDPIAEWRKTFKEIKKYETKLNNLNIEKLHLVGPDADLWMKMGKERKWISGSGRNIPSFEIFTSPNWRGTNGWIRFNVPLYRYGTLIEGIELEFKDGKVIKSKAKKNEKVLKAMIATLNADKMGEYSLTDKRHSRITKFMAETLYDENIGGPNGNTHLALGNSFHDAYKGNPAKVSKKQWDKMGYNVSSVHTDIFSTAPRTVTAYLPNGQKKVIYKNGQFTL